MRTQGEAGDAGDQILGNHCHLIAHSTPQVCSVRRKTPSHCSAGVLIHIKPPHLLRISRSSRSTSEYASMIVTTDNCCRWSSTSSQASDEASACLVQDGMKRPNADAACQSLRDNAEAALHRHAESKTGRTWSLVSWNSHDL